MFDANFGIDAVPIAHVAVLWPDVEEWFQKAIDHTASFYTVAYFRERVMKGEMTLYLVCDSSGPIAAYILKFQDMPKGRVLEVMLLGGIHMETWFLKAQAHIDSVAKKAACLAVVATGRRGWERHLGRFGWKSGPITMMREIV